MPSGYLVAIFKWTKEAWGVDGSAVPIEAPSDVVTEP